MYLRFTVPVKDADSGSPTGVFTAAYTLLDSGELAEYEQARLRELLDWFVEHLRVPPCLKDAQNPRAICWFGAEAREHLAKVWELVWLLRENGVIVRMETAAAVGDVVYADAFQVAATPWRDRRGKRRWRR